jgi:hypothetical protein
MMWNIKSIAGPVKLLGELELSDHDLSHPRFAEGMGKIQAIHKEVLNSPEAAEFLKQFLGQPIEFSVQTTEERGVVLKVNGKEKQIATFEELRNGKKGLKSAFSLYQGAYQIATRLNLGKQIQSQALVQKQYAQKAAERQIPVVTEPERDLSWLVKKLIVGDIALADVLSMVRNTLNIFHAKSGADKAASLFTVILPMMIAGGVMAMVAAFYLAVMDVCDIVKDLKNGDVRAALWHLVSFFIDISFFAFGVSMLSASSLVLAYVGTVGGAIFYGLLGIEAMVKMKENRAFRSEMNQILHRQEGTPTERLAETLRWVQAQVTVNDFDRMNSVSDVAKWSAFTRRTSADCCQKMRSELSSDLIARVEQGDKAAIEQALGLVETVSKANFESILFAVTRLAIVGLGLAALFTSPLVSAILFAVGAFCWFTVGGDFKPISQRIGNTAWNIHKKLWWKTASPIEMEGVCSKTTSVTSSTTSDPKGASLLTA